MDPTKDHEDKPDTYRPMAYIVLKNISISLFIIFILCAIFSIIIGINTHANVNKKHYNFINYVVIILILGCTVCTPISYAACLSALIILWANRDKFKVSPKTLK